MKLSFKASMTAVMGVAVMSFATLSAAQDVTGAGATFPAPLYSKWAADYNKATNIKINYQSVGSGAGIRQIEAKTVDFGASDMPLKPEELNKQGLMQFPTVIGGVVAYFSLSLATGVVPYVLAIAAASFIYVAVADLIPGLHKRPEFSATMQQLALIILGVNVIVVADYVLH